MSRLALLFLCGCATARPATQLRVGDTLDFELPDLKGGAVSRQDLLGKVVLVDLWATWCKPCKVSLPFYKSLHEARAKDGLEVVAISVDVHREDVERFIASEELPFTVLHDPEGTVPARIGISTMPTMFLLGRDGKIAYVHTGFADSDRDRISEEVDKALRAVVAPPGETAK